MGYGVNCLVQRQQLLGWLDVDGQLDPGWPWICQQRPCMGEFQQKKNGLKEAQHRVAIFVTFFLVLNAGGGDGPLLALLVVFYRPAELRWKAAEPAAAQRHKQTQRTFRRSRPSMKSRGSLLLLASLVLSTRSLGSLACSFFPYISFLVRRRKNFTP